MQQILRIENNSLSVHRLSVDSFMHSIDEGPWLVAVVNFILRPNRVLYDVDVSKVTHPVIKQEDRISPKLIAETETNTKVENRRFDSVEKTVLGSGCILFDNIDDDGTCHCFKWRHRDLQLFFFIGLLSLILKPEELRPKPVTD